MAHTISSLCSEEAQEYVEMGSLNGLFVLGRTMGFIGECILSTCSQMIHCLVATCGACVQLISVLRIH